MDILEITNTIAELEGRETTFANCEKLASLYIVRDNLSADIVMDEYSDILPSYVDYCKYKKQYQLGEVDEKCMVLALQRVCQEIFEFINTLYISVDAESERSTIINMLQNLSTL